MTARAIDRALVALPFILCIAATDARAGETGRRAIAPPAPDRAEVEARISLPASAIAPVVDAWTPMVRACWIKYGPQVGPGLLRLELTIDREGMVFSGKVVVPGRRTGRRLERCVLGLLDQWRFPMRDGFTSAVVPFQFVRTAVRGAGPRPSCYSPRGCRSGRAR